MTPVGVTFYHLDLNVRNSYDKMSHSLMYPRATLSKDYAEARTRKSPSISNIRIELRTKQPRRSILMLNYLVTVRDKLRRTDRTVNT